MTPTDQRPATRKQLAYLRALAHRTGQTFTPPTTAAEASREISRLKAVATTGFSFAELEAERAAREAHGDVPYSPAIRGHEVRGYGAGATWSQRS